MNVIILGAGIGGLTAALALHAAGIRCRVFEANPVIKPLGVGINILPHSVRELAELGLLQALDREGIRTAELVYATKRGEVVWREERGMNAGYRWPQFSIHRGYLQMLLYDAVCERLGADAVVTDHAAVDVTQTASGATVRFESRALQQRHPAHASPTADVVIAADGIHSAIRKKYYPDEGPPVWSKRILWRGTTVMEPFLTGASMAVAGYAWKKWVCYPIKRLADDKLLTNWIAELTLGTTDLKNAEDWNRLGKLEDFMPDFEKWDFDWMHVARIIRESGEVFEYPMSDRNPVPTWNFGRVTLLGDAAHGCTRLDQTARRKRSWMPANWPMSWPRSPALLRPWGHMKRIGSPQPPRSWNSIAKKARTACCDWLKNEPPTGLRTSKKLCLWRSGWRYKLAAGFDRDTLNNRASMTVSQF